MSPPERDTAGWELVAERAHKTWSLANDDFEAGDEAIIKEHMAALLAEAERNGANVMDRLEGRHDG